MDKENMTIPCNKLL